MLRLLLSISLESFAPTHFRFFNLKQNENQPFVWLFFFMIGCSFVWFELSTDINFSSRNCSSEWLGFLFFWLQQLLPDMELTWTLGSDDFESLSYKDSITITYIILVGLNHNCFYTWHVVIGQCYKQIEETLLRIRSTLWSHL